jgi:hypothetical protein
MNNKIKNNNNNGKPNPTHTSERSFTMTKLASSQGSRTYANL